MIKYLGSKRLLVPLLLKRVQELLPEAKTFLDLFSGTSRVGHAFKKAGFQVWANDLSTYGHHLARCYVQADRSVWEGQARKLLEELQGVAPSPGYFTETFCERSRFFHPKNGAKVDAIRGKIQEWDLPPELESILLISLMEAADRVDSTCGVQMAYLKTWAPRALGELELRLPEILEGAGRALQGDALEIVQGLPEVDVAYLDPPYNQHSYLGNYHIWETLCLWDSPEVYGKAMKRVDCQTRKSSFNSKRTAKDVLAALIPQVKARLILLSFNDEGFLSREEIEAMLRPLGKVETTCVDYRRYIGSQIGVFSPAGEKVGEPGKGRNTEYVFSVLRAA